MPLASTHPELAARLLDPDPTTVVAGSARTGTWQCSEQPHTFTMRISRHIEGARCPYCSRRQVLPGFNDLATTHPDVAATLVDADPTQILAGSVKVLHWRCANHEQPYPMSVSERVHGTTCGYCSNHRLLPGFNDLATTHSQLASEVIDPDPSTVMAGAGAVVQWRCANHDEPYAMKVRERIKGHGCGYCAGKKVLPGFNDLATVRPDVAADILDADPATVLAVSGKKATWRCANHSEPYTATIADRVNGSGCPYCSGLRTLRGYNDLATTRPDLADLLLEPDPTTVSAGSDKTGTWRCDAHEGTYTMRIAHRTSTSGCPFCSGKRLLAGMNDLATTHPQLAAELVDVDPTTVSAGMSRMCQWACPNHDEPFTASINHRVAGNNCPYCANRQLLPGFNDVASVYPKLAPLLLDTDPAEVVAGGATKHWWRCDAHPQRPYQSTVRHRAREGACPICAGRLLAVGVNDLASQRPDLASQLVSPDASSVTIASSTSGVWRCPNHAEPYTSPIRNRVEGRGCPVCAGKKVVVGVNDVASRRPDLASQLVSPDARTVTVGSRKRGEWSCPQHPAVTYFATISDRTNGTGCPFCAGKRLLPGFNDLATLRPDLAAEMIDPDPTTVMRGAVTKAKWRCSTCGREWVKSVRSRSYDHSGCPGCNLGGYDVTAAGYLYLMERSGEQQVGITNDPQTRLAVHARKGWELLEVTDAMNGQRVFDIELQVRRWLRAQGWAMDGTAENWSTANLEVTTLRELFTAAGVIDPATGAAPSR